jgi:hypothetical protein
VLLGLVEELVRHGACDLPFDGHTALDHAEELVEKGLAEYRPVADRLRVAAWRPSATKP